MTTVKVRPILFSGAMIRALLDGRKSQTRRVVKPQPHRSCELWASECEPQDGKFAFTGDGNECFVKCPYGKVGDRLWVRETWAPFDDRELDPPEFVWYRADMTARNIDGEILDTYAMPEPKWKPSIFMPRAISRLTLEITNIRVQRVQKISRADAMAEGLYEFTQSHGTYYGIQHADVWETDPRRTFERLWDSINGKKYPWQSNPWVWAISFKRVQP